jgi:hypothetical protein
MRNLHWLMRTGGSDGRGINLRDGGALAGAGCNEQHTNHQPVEGFSEMDEMFYHNKYP